MSQRGGIQKKILKSKATADGLPKLTPFLCSVSVKALMHHNQRMTGCFTHESTVLHTDPAGAPPQ